MTKRVFVTAQEVPNADYIIPGKEYETIEFEDMPGAWYWARVKAEQLDDEDDGLISICTDSCPHLDGLSWTVRIEE